MSSFWIKLWGFSIYVHQCDWPVILLSYAVLVSFWCQCFVSEMSGECSLFFHSQYKLPEKKNLRLLFHFLSLSILSINLNLKCMWGTASLWFWRHAGTFPTQTSDGNRQTCCLVPLLAGGFFSCLLFLRRCSLFKGFVLL